MTMRCLEASVAKYSRFLAATSGAICSAITSGRMGNEARQHGEGEQSALAFQHPATHIIVLKRTLVRFAARGDSASVSARFLGGKWRQALKIAAITAGAQGIGRAIAYEFARAGYAVSMLDPADDAGAEALAEVRALGSNGVYVKGGTGSEADIDAWLAATADALGCPDVLVNNAGIMVRKPFLELPVADFDRVIAVNLRGAFLCSQKVARRMVAENGAIVNIASTRAFMSEPGTEGYTASKGGIVALTHGMAISLGPCGIRVNAISPGWIETGDWQYSGRAETPQHSERDRLQHPVGRVGKPEDIAEACLFLAEGAGFMTGQNIVIDGGMTVKMIYEE